MHDRGVHRAAYHCPCRRRDDVPSRHLQRSARAALPPSRFPPLPSFLPSFLPSLLPSSSFPPLPSLLRWRRLYARLAPRVRHRARWRPLSFSLNARQNMNEYEHENISIYNYSNCEYHSNKIHSSSSMMQADTEGAVYHTHPATTRGGVGGWVLGTVWSTAAPSTTGTSGRHTSTNTRLACDTQGERTCIAHRTRELGQSYEACSRIITYVHTRSPSRDRGGHGGRGGCWMRPSCLRSPATAGAAPAVADAERERNGRGSALSTTR